MADKIETFVHDGIEVVKTGREAQRVVNVAGSGKRVLTLVEIKPLNDSFDTLKWVDPAQLYNIKG